VIRLNLPDGTVANFPDDTPPDVMKQAAQQYLMSAAAEQGTAKAQAGAEARSAGASPMPSDPGFYGDPGDPRNIIQAAQQRGTAAAAGPTTGILGGAVVGPALGAVAGAVPAAAPMVAAALGKPGQAVYGAYQGYKHGGGIGGALIGAGAAVAGGAALGKLGAKILPFLRGAAPAAEGAAVGAETAVVKATPEAAKTIAAELGVTRDVAKQIITPVAPAVQAEAAQAVSQVAPAAAKALTQEELKLIAQLRGIAQSSGSNKIQVVQAAQKVWPDSWKEMVKLIMAPRTTMPTIYQP